MQELFNVRSIMVPSEVSPYGEFGIDYNYDIEEIVEETDVEVKDEFGNLVLDEETGEPVKEKQEVISYEYKTKRFDSIEEFNTWKENNL